MTFHSKAAASLLVASLLLIGGCDQAEKSAQQLLGKAAETAKQAIDDTHQAANEALSEATEGVISIKPKASEPEDEKASSSQEI